MAIYHSAAIYECAATDRIMTLIGAFTQYTCAGGRPPVTRSTLELPWCAVSRGTFFRRAPVLRRQPWLAVPRSDSRVTCHRTLAWPNGVLSAARRELCGKPEFRTYSGVLIRATVAYSSEVRQMGFDRLLHWAGFPREAHRGSPASGRVTTKMPEADAPSQAKRTPDFGRYIPLSGPPEFRSLEAPLGWRRSCPRRVAWRCGDGDMGVRPSVCSL